MPEVMAPVQPQTAKRCPACGRVSAASERCLHCWRDIAAVVALPPEEAESALKVEARLARRREAGWLTVGRMLRFGSLAVVVVLAGWGAYAILTGPPPPPEAPSSTVRSAAAGAWSTQDGDNRGTRSTAASAHLGGAEAWRAALGSPAATALVTDGRLIVAPLQDGRMVGIEASSGKTLWTATLTLGNPPLSAPVIAGDRIYVAQREGLIMALSASDGKEVWRRGNVADSFEASPLVVDGVVYAHSARGMFAFDAEDGRTLWEQVFNIGSANVAPAVEGQYLVIATADKAIVFDRASGEQLYYVTFSRSRPSSITIRDGNVLAVYGRSATMFDASSHHPWWERLTSASIGGETVRSFWFRMHVYGMAPAMPIAATVWDAASLPKKTMAAAVGQNVVVVTSPDGAVTALGWADGKPAWTAKTGRLVAAPIVTGDGVLFMEENRLLLLDITTGQQRAERKVDGLRGATPAEAAMYIATGAGDVIALR